jgi:hypothetical protein
VPWYIQPYWTIHYFRSNTIRMAKCILEPFTESCNSNSNLFFVTRHFKCQKLFAVRQSALCRGTGCCGLASYVTNENKDIPLSTLKGFLINWRWFCCIRRSSGCLRTMKIRRTHSSWSIHPRCKINKSKSGCFQLFKISNVVFWVKHGCICNPVKTRFYRHSGSI